MPSGATLPSKCQKVLDYINRYTNSANGFWVAVGQQEPWPDENEPPIFHTNLQELPGLIGFVYVHTVQAVFEDAEGPIDLPTTAFRVITDLEPITMAAAKANHCHFEATVTKDVLETFAASYRSLAICTDIEFISGFTPVLEVGSFVQPVNVASYFMDWVSTVRAVTVADQDNHTYRIIRTF